ncbi:MAG: ATP-dependent DNA helicase RecG, partial [Solirubrobacterales bacterium]|nr:ATP-dependent DNA helicase RecG [Solirubrobacterales bacterium]
MPGAARTPAPEPGVRALGGASELSRAGMLEAPVHWPRPSRLRRPLKPGGGRATRGLAALGIDTVESLLEHLPRDRREARAIARLAPGEQATIAVEVATIAARA